MPSRQTCRVLRWVPWTAAVLAVSAMALWGLPLWLTPHPHVEGAERHTAIVATQVGIVALLVALGAAITVRYGLLRWAIWTVAVPYTSATARTAMATLLPTLTPAQQMILLR